MPSARCAARCAGIERMLRALIALLLALTTASVVRAQAPTLRLVGADGEVSVEGLLLDGAAAFPADVLARLGARIIDDIVETRAIIDGDTLVFAAGSPFFRSS